MKKIIKSLFAFAFLIGSIISLFGFNPINVQAEEHEHEWTYHLETDGKTEWYDPVYHKKECTKGCNTILEERHQHLTDSTFCECGLDLSLVYSEDICMEFKQGFVLKFGLTAKQITDNLILNDSKFKISNLRIVTQGTYNEIKPSEVLYDRHVIAGTVEFVNKDKLFEYHIDDISQEMHYNGRLTVADCSGRDFGIVNSSGFYSLDFYIYYHVDTPGGVPGTGTSPNPENHETCGRHWVLLLFMVLYCVSQVGIYLLVSREPLNKKEKNKKSPKLTIANISYLGSSLLFLILGIIIARCGFCITLLILSILLILVISGLAICSMFDIGANSESKPLSIIYKFNSYIPVVDAIKLAKNNPSKNISKNDIAKYIEENHKDSVVTSNMTFPTLPQADVYSILAKKNDKDVQKKFLYVYEVEMTKNNQKCNGLVLLIKMKQKDVDSSKYNNVYISSFPIGCKWSAIIVDESYTVETVSNLIEEVYNNLSK